MKRLQKRIAILLLVVLALGACAAAEGFASINPASWEPLERGAKGEAVIVLQQRLIELGYLDDRTDGSFGRRTEAALLAFQRTASLEITGVADASTMEALLDPSAPKFDPELAAEWAEMVWIPNTGQRYHSNKKCSGMKNPTYVTLEEAIQQGFTPCKNCYR